MNTNDTSSNKKRGRSKLDPVQRKKRKVRALYILTGLVFSAIIFLLSLYAILLGEGALLWDVVLSLFAGLSAAALYSGLIFPVFALVAVPLIPVLFYYYYWKNFKK